MKGKSNSFRQVTPFYPKSGILASSYRAFPIDNSGVPATLPSACLRIDPSMDAVSEGIFGGEFSPTSFIYSVDNIGGASMDWTLVLGETWITSDNYGGALDVGESVLVTLTIDPDGLPSSQTPYSSTIIFTNTSNDCGSITLSALLTVNPEPIDVELDWTGNGGLATAHISGRLTFIEFNPMTVSWDARMEITSFISDPASPFGNPWLGQISTDISPANQLSEFVPVYVPNFVQGSPPGFMILTGLAPGAPTFLRAKLFYLTEPSGLATTSYTSPPIP